MVNDLVELEQFNLDERYVLDSIDKQRYSYVSMYFKKKSRNFKNVLKLLLLHNRIFEKYISFGEIVFEIEYYYDKEDEFMGGKLVNYKIFKGTNLIKSENFKSHIRYATCSMNHSVSREELFIVKDGLISLFSNENLNKFVNYEELIKNQAIYNYSLKDFIIDLQELFKDKSNVKSEQEFLDRRFKRYVESLSDVSYSDYLNSDTEIKKKQALERLKGRF